MKKYVGNCEVRKIEKEGKEGFKETKIDTQKSVFQYTFCSEFYLSCFTLFRVLMDFAGKKQQIPLENFKSSPGVVC